MLCLGIAATACTVGFAQEDVTSKLRNADMEKGIVGWDIKFESNVWKRMTSLETSYHGVDGVCIYNYKSDATSGLTDNSISQSLEGLPNGVYVFGAYAVASLKDVVENREVVTGVTLFANEAFVPVATNYPEYVDEKWSHSAKFNVAVKVTDGTLKVGMEAKETNANFLLLDNATLYYFGEEADMEAALDEMAKIDLAASAAIADTCVAHKMQVDTLAYLKEQSAAAKAVTGAAGAYEADENVWWASRLARKSIAAYQSFKEAVEDAKEVAAIDWSVDVKDPLESLNALIAQAEKTWEDAVATTGELEALEGELAEAAELVKLDSVYLNLEAYDVLISEIDPGEALGEYSEDMVHEMQDLLGTVEAILAELEEGASAADVRQRCENVFAQIKEILANPISFDEFPIHIGRGTTEIRTHKVLEGAAINETTNLVEFHSKTYHFDHTLSKIRFVVMENGSSTKHSGMDYQYFTLSGFAMYDGEGNEIFLNEDMITSNADHVVINPADYPKEGLGIEALIDGNPDTFFHSAWKNGPSDNHYLEVALPEGEYSAFSFSMAARSSSNLHTGQFPAVIDIVYVSDAMTNLQNTVAEAREMHPYQGLVPGLTSVDPAPFYEAFDAAEALLAAGNASEATVNATLENLTAQMKAADEAVIMPEPGKAYRIVNAGDFLGSQGVMKALTVKIDSVNNHRLYWETAMPDSLDQLFSFEVMENEEGLNYFVVKHEATGMYVSDYIAYDGYYEVNAFGLSTEKDTVELKSLGYGQFGLYCGERTGKTNSNQMHAVNHSSGAGVSGAASKWFSSANDWSAWYIREMCALPFEAKSISDLHFETTSISLYEGVNSLVLKADKKCAFADFVVYDLLGNVIPSTVSVNDTAAIVMMDTDPVESFSFTFTNTEGVTSVKVDGTISKLSELQAAYDEALAAAPVKGEEIGQYRDLTEYEAALKAAENLLANGGSDEEILTTVALIDSAMEHLLMNYPEEDKEYFMLFVYPKFKEINGVDMGIYVREDAALWSYVNAADPAYLWKFVVSTPASKGVLPTFYLQNVATQTYLGYIDKLSAALSMVDETSETDTYRIYVEDGETVVRTRRYTNCFLHPKNHSSGAGVYGSLIYWKESFNSASSIRIVEKERYIQELTDGIEDIEVVDEFVAPAKKGTYDLFGRRIDAPAATGIYIVDGKKRVIKK